MLIVSTAATKTALTTLAAFKLELGKTDGADDAWLTGQIEVASAICCAYLGVPMATDGSMHLGRETLVETMRLNRGHPRRLRWDVRRRELLLSRWPVSSITSVVVDGTTLDAADTEVEGSSGLLLRLNSDLPSFWTGNTVLVTYVAGWVLPDMKGADDTALTRNLPQDIEDACIGLVKSQWFARKRDPMVKSESIPGVRDVDYWVGSIPGASGALPADVTAKLDPYRFFPMG